MNGHPRAFGLVAGVASLCLVAALMASSNDVYNEHVVQQQQDPRSTSLYIFHPQPAPQASRSRIRRAIHGRAGHIRSLQNRILHRRVTQDRTRVVITSSDSKNVLLGLGRSGIWGLPGGAMNDHELPLACARREVKEETGLSALSDELDCGRAEEGEWLFRMSVTHTTPQPSVSGDPDHEFVKLQWFPACALPNNCYSDVPANVKKALAHGDHKHLGDDSPHGEAEIPK